MMEIHIPENIFLLIQFILPFWTQVNYWSCNPLIYITYVYSVHVYISYNYLYNL